MKLLTACRASGSGYRVFLVSGEDDAGAEPICHCWAPHPSEAAAWQCPCVLVHFLERGVDARKSFPGAAGDEGGAGVGEDG